MNRSLPWFWILLAALLLAAPTPLGRLLLDLLGGLTLVVLLLPLLLAGAGVIAFQVLRSRVRTCSVCGFSSMATVSCPACGSPFTRAADESPAPNSQLGQVGQTLPVGFTSWLWPKGGVQSEAPLNDPNLDVSDVTIDVESKDVDSG